MTIPLFKKMYPVFVPIVLGILLLPIPLLGDFHFESAALAAVAGAIWAAFSFLKGTYSQDKKKLLRIIGAVYLFSLPLFFAAFFGGCFSLQGLWFWLLTPVPSVLLGASLGRFLRAAKIRFKKTALLLILILGNAGIFLIEFTTLPQVYFFNHFWGFYPGPIFDEAVTISRSYLYFRTVTFVWILLLWNLPRLRLQNLNRIIVSICTLILVFAYLNLGNLGIITPRAKLKTTLSFHKQTEHFELYMNPAQFTEAEADYWAAKHEFYFNEITKQLEINWPANRKIESYLYGNAWQKKALAGAKFTSYVPIWLAQDQLHIAKQQLAGVLKHELVHVISKQFGNKLFNGSLNIGLIEGLAEAVSGGSSPESSLQQIVAADENYPSAIQMKNALSVTGFYKNSAAVSYTTTGAFVQFLLNTYPVEYFKKAYPTADFNAHYPVPFEDLVAQWEKELAATVFDSTDKKTSEFLFSQLSLFQKKCPHLVTHEQMLWDTYLLRRAESDSSGAAQIIQKLHQSSPSNPLLKREWAQSELSFGRLNPVIRSVSDEDTLLTLQLLKADAFFLSGDFVTAKNYLENLKPKLEKSTASNLKYSYQMRADSLNWRVFSSARYENSLPGVEVFRTLNNPVQSIVIQKAIELGKFGNLPAYSRLIFEKPIQSDWFDMYESLIDRLVYTNNFTEADKWISGLNAENFRTRYRERLREQELWLEFRKAER